MDIKNVLNMLIGMLPDAKEDVNIFIDSGLDGIEDKYEDNTIIIMACQLLRKTLQVPDND